MVDLKSKPRMKKGEVGNVVRVNYEEEQRERERGRECGR